MRTGSLPITANVRGFGIAATAFHVGDHGYLDARTNSLFETAQAAMQ